MPAIPTRASLRIPSAATEPAPPAPSPTATPGLATDESLALKAQRAYERDRQRVLRTREHAAHESAKGTRTHRRPCFVCQDTHGKPKWRAGVPAQQIFADAATDAVLAPGVGAGEGEERIGSPVDLGALLGKALESEGPGTAEVSIAALVRPGRKSKSRAAGDFEVVPSVRSVIVLDEEVEPEADEAWEHVSADELDEAPRRVEVPTYARVVASAM